MLVEYVHGDFLNVVGFPLNHFCKKLAELYFPPHPEGLRRAKHDSIPTVDTFEDLSDLSDVEGGGSNPAQIQQGHRQGGAQVGGDRPPAQGAEDADPKRTVESLPPSVLLDVIDGFKASKVRL